MDVVILKEFVELSGKIKKMAAELKELERQKRSLEEPISEMLVEAGVTNIKIDGHTIYLHTQIWASATDIITMTGEVVGKDYERSVNALKDAGYADMVETRFNTQRVSAMIRELVRNGEEIPEVLEDNLKITEKVQPRARRS